MMRVFAAILLLVVLTGISGCAICCTPYDYAYSAYGGRWPRTDMTHGRVGSAFAPAGAPVSVHGPPIAAEGPILAPGYELQSPTPASIGPTLAPGY